MGFGRKKQVQGPLVTQDNVAMLATEALARMRASRIRLAIRLIFTSPILMHRWAQKAVVELLTPMVTGAKLPRTKKDLTADYEQSWYRNAYGELAIPCRIIKACIVEGGGDNVGGVVSKAQLKRELRVLGFTAPIRLAKGTKVEMDVAIVRNDGGGPDVRARAKVPAGCHIDCVLEFPPTLSADQVTAALMAAGDVMGVCDWRPQRGGNFGQFVIDAEAVKADKRSIERIIQECNVPEEEFVIPTQLLKALDAVPAEKLSDRGRKVKALLEHVNGGGHINGGHALTGIEAKDGKRGGGRSKGSLPASPANTAAE